jgi:hypothetical protein
MGEHHLHIHAMRYEHGQMFVDIGDHGRTITLEISPQDHPALQQAWDDLERCAVTAAQSVMLDILGGLPDIPPVVPVPMRLCRICDVAVPSMAPPGQAVYCPRHEPVILGEGGE